MAVINAPIPGTGTAPAVYPGMEASVTTATHRPYTLENMDSDEGLRLDAINTRCTPLWV